MAVLFITIPRIIILNKNQTNKYCGVFLRLKNGTEKIGFPI